jgi:3-methyladenine DNA glycosylase AlkD
MPQHTETLTAVLRDLNNAARPDTASLRAVRRKYSRALQTAPAPVVLKLARTLIDRGAPRWVAYELVQYHPEAFDALNLKTLEQLGQGIDSWWTVDAFGRSLTGPAWLHGNIADAAVKRWARSKDRWWRRTALVSTVALNTKSQGGLGDAERTLEICGMLADDWDDMIVKALSWALRALAPHQPQAVSKFLRGHDDQLAARVKREAMHKLTTGLKNPRRRQRSD